MNKSTASGKIDQLKGKIKQGLGEATDNDRMANSGTMDQVKGNAKEAWGDTKDAARSASSDHYDASHTYPADERMRDDKHNLRDKVTSMARDAKEAVSERTDNFKSKRSA
jgi:uncharacterized protein YjbJ (UPF0337 family)